MQVVFEMMYFSMPNDPQRKQDMPEAVVCRRENDLTEKVDS